MYEDKSNGVLRKISLDLFRTGTSITNTLVAFSQLGNRNEFARSFSSGVLMDVFNYLTTLLLLPLEVLIDRLTPCSDPFHRSFLCTHCPFHFERSLL